MKVKVALLFCFLLAFVSLLLSSARLEVKGGYFLSANSVRNIDTGFQYETIQEAINAKETLDGQRIEAGVGTYFEYVVVNKSITLVGQGTPGLSIFNTIIDGKGNGTIIQVSAPNVALQNLALQNSGSDFEDCGIWVNSSVHCELSYNKLQNNSVGIFLDNSSSCFVSDNDISHNKCGIFINDCEHCTIYNEEWGDRNVVNPRLRGNIIESNDYGIWINSSRSCDVVWNNDVQNNGCGILVDFSESCRIGTNIVDNNGFGIRMRNSENCQIRPIGDDWDPAYINNNTNGILLESSKNCLVEAYHLNIRGYGASGITLLSSEDCLVRENSVSNIMNGTTWWSTESPNGFFLGGCTNCTVENNYLENVQFACILVFYSSQCPVSNNQVSTSRYGILQVGSENVTISNNEVSNNQYGIDLQGTSSSTVKENKIYDNSNAGIRLESDKNIFYGNLLFNNSRHVENTMVNVTLRGYNTWDDGRKGNYWDDYQGFDTDGDRIGEAPYVIDGKNIDFYPLTGAPSEDYRPPIVTFCGIMNALSSSSNIQVDPLDVVKVQAAVIDQQSGVRQVILRYGTADSLNYSVSMVRISGDVFNGTYEGWICPWVFLDADSWGMNNGSVNLTFEVEATDYANNVRRPGSFSFSTAEPLNMLNVDVIVSQVYTQDDLSVDLDFNVNGYLPAWIGEPLYLEVSNSQGSTRLNAIQLSIQSVVSNQKHTLSYLGTQSGRLSLVGESESYPFDSYYVNMTFRFQPPLPYYLADAHWTNEYSEAFSLISENFYKMANVNLSVTGPHYVQQGPLSTWGPLTPKINYALGSHSSVAGFDVVFVFVRQLNNVLPLILLIISTTYMLGATMLGDARWNPEVKTAIYLSFFVMVAGFNFALRYLIPFRYGLTVAEVVFVTLTVATAVFSIGVIVSNILFTKVSEKMARRANLVLDTFSISLSAILLAIFLVPISLLAIEVVGLAFGFVIRITFLDRQKHT